MVAATVCFSTVSHIHPLPIRETLQDQQVGLSQTSIRLLLCSLGPVMCGIWGVPFKSEVSVSPSPVVLLKLSQLAFNVKCSGGSSLWCKISGPGNLMWGSEHLPQEKI